ncbi:kielin/chordin-like protein [Gigantopelta aegis]|uniref:kielin/chordin-like protein n=1 Tax=Gigantopelta aegis TaxID=1735272 RepID=UPI001B88A1F8|nr:kielin/chordin-like protein [Gigantopelta aegis]
MSIQVLSVFISFYFSAYGVHIHGLTRRDGDLGCLYGNVFERVGTTFASRDGCNTCTCSYTGMSCTTNICSGSGVLGNCNINGIVQQAGTTWLAADGCNTCTCTGGQVACTQFTCGVTQALPVSTCTTLGITYQSGQTWKARDRCNTCTCIRGQITCTQFACTTTTPRTCYVKGVQMQSGQSWTAPDGCNRCTCRNGFSSCMNTNCNTNPNNPNSHTGVTCYDNIAHLFHPEGHTWTNKCGTCNCNLGITTCTNPSVSNHCPGYYGTGGTGTGTGTGTGSGGVLGSCYDTQTKVSYSDGQSFKAPDGCNDCVCLRGVILCSKGSCVVGR